jgi:membrane associated rhomboid family serine protease
LRKSIDAIIVIVVITGIFYLLTEHVPGLKDEMFERFALYLPENPRFELWQPVSTMFMHGGFFHLLMNMYALWAFGTPLEQLWGVKRFLLFYFAAGIGASVIYSAVNLYRFKQYTTEFLAAGVSNEQLNDVLDTDFRSLRAIGSASLEQTQEFWLLFHVPAVGASGAVYGILVAFGMLFPNAKLALIFFPVPIAAKYFIPVLIALDLFSGVTGVSIFGGGIAHFAHVGGALIGFLLMLLFGGKRRHPGRMENTGEY